MSPPRDGDTSFVLQIDGGVHAVDIALVELAPQQLDRFLAAVSMK